MILLESCRILLESFRILFESCRILLESCRILLQSCISRSCQTFLTVTTMIYGLEKRCSKKGFDISMCALLIIKADGICVYG
jgi:hypothetical protein